MPDTPHTDGAAQQTVETNQRETEYSATIEEYDLGESMHRRARTTIAKWQRHELERLFTKYRYPTLEKVEQLSEQLGLPQYVIKVTNLKVKVLFLKKQDSVLIQKIGHMQVISNNPNI